MSISSVIKLRGCRQHNLKSLSIDLPKGALIAITGVSGSGKSSLAFDTLYAEGQRRYLEYLSTDARKSIKQLPKPDIDIAEGLSPTLAIGQRHTSLSRTSTVATHTDIHDFLALLFATIGQQHSPKTGKPLTCYTRQEIVEAIMADYPAGAKMQLIAPVARHGETANETLMRLQRSGFIRILVDGTEWESGTPDETASIEVVIDRLVMKDDIRDRLAGSIETALDLSQGILKVIEGRDGAATHYTEVFLDPDTGESFPPLEPRDFSFVSPRGACPICAGAGGREHTREKDANGDGDASDDPFFVQWEACPECHGARLKVESLACRIAGRNIAELTQLSVSDLLKAIAGWELEEREATIASELLPDITSRLQFLEEVGLGYLELDRRGNTLSEGEKQRVQLASLIGAKLSGILYVLDEPSQGLHPQDIDHLRGVLKTLRDLGNTVVIVEHNKSLIEAADHVVEIGPGAGIHGGEVTFAGTTQALKTAADTATGPWLAGTAKLPEKKRRRKATGALALGPVSHHNLKGLELEIPLGQLVAFCGVSGSGKSTLAIDVVAQTLAPLVAGNGDDSAVIRGYENIERLAVTGQQQAGLSPRSMPATYLGIMTPLRRLFSETKLAKARGYDARRFSLNARGGRCEACKGLGTVRVDMQFMPDVWLPCDVCHGRRYNYETLQVNFKGVSVGDVLDMSIEDGARLFEHIPDIAMRLELATELGLGYLSLGQRFTTVSGGEAQRLKLVRDLASRSLKRTLYIMDEPSAGLHFEDVKKLVKILHRLVDAGHSVIAIDHNMDVIQQADTVIEMGPKGGPEGGKVIFQGTIDALANANTATGRCL